MATKKELEVLVESLQGQLSRATMALVDKQGKVDLSDLPDETVIVFEKRFGKFQNAPTYTYAAIKVAGRWYRTAGNETNQARHPYSDSEMTSFIAFLDNVFVCTDLTPLQEVDTNGAE